LIVRGFLSPVFFAQKNILKKISILFGGLIVFVLSLIYQIKNKKQIS
jgi:hypothetical protein